MNDEVIVEIGDTSADFGFGVTVTLSEANAKLLLKVLRDSEDHCGCLGRDHPFHPLVRGLKKVLAPDVD